MKRFEMTITLLGCLALLVLSGCSLTTMQTSRQLEKGQLLGSAGLDAPGSALIIPRASASVMYGFGGGDVGAHIGTAWLTANAGASVRGYLGPHLIGALQSDVLVGANSSYSAWGTIDPLGIEGDAILILSPRLITATSDTMRAYGGGQSNILFGIAGANEAVTYENAIFGLILGWEEPVSDRANLQVEGTLTPAALGDFADGPLWQIGFAFNWRTGSP